ncbi:MAG: PorP/SprF family type IX secretion system membrane protein [Flavobacteriales bacterium]|jgi:type IX secretion system PorP/SprF family membrane protein
MRKSITILLLCWSAAAFGQLQPQMTQHMYNPMPFNPATAGYREALSGTISHRQLWRAFDGTPTTHTLGIHAPVFNPSFGAGLLVQHDEIGVSRSLGIAAQFAYRMRTGKTGKLCFGLKAGVINQLDKWSAVITTDAGDDAFTIGDTQSWLPDVGAGIYYYKKKYYAGFSVPTFFSRRYDGAGIYAPKFAPVESTFVLHTGGIVDLSKSLNIQPSLLARYQQVAGYQIEMGAMFNLKERFGLGGAYRMGQSWTAMMRLFITKQLALVYAYDRFIFEAQTFDRGTHEITLSLDLVRYTKAPDTRFF